MKVPVIRIINGSVFIQYDGALYNEHAFRAIHKHLYEAFFQTKPTFKLQHEEVACV